MLTFEQIKELVELVAQRRLQGLEIERSGFRLKIDGYTQIAAPAAPPAAAPPPAGGEAPPPAGSEPAPEDGHILTSPIVGTFYRSPGPDAPPFVEVGSRVKKGQELCIIEAMKVMNPINSDVDGVVTRIFPQNGQPVEFGEPLFAIRVD